MTVTGSYYENVKRPQQEADARFEEIGGLPEIDQAKASLDAALDKTKMEVDNAVFADRFSDTAFASAEEAQAHSSSVIRSAVQEQGDISFKRQQLTVDFLRVRDSINTALSHLVKFRADLIISQTNYDQPSAVEE